MGMYCDIYAPEEDEIRELLDQPGRIEYLFSVEDQTTPSLSLEKCWHGLHFLLTGTAWDGEEPLCFLLIGGEPVGNGDGFEYGPPRAFDTGRLREIDRALAAIDSEELARRFDPMKMMDEGIYPQIWDRDPEEDDTLGELVEYYGDLKTFIRKAVDENRGLVVTLG